MIGLLVSGLISKEAGWIGPQSRRRKASELSADIATSTSFPTQRYHFALLQCNAFLVLVPFCRMTNAKRLSAITRRMWCWRTTTCERRSVFPYRKPRKWWRLSARIQICWGSWVWWTTGYHSSTSCTFLRLTIENWISLLVGVKKWKFEVEITDEMVRCFDW